MKKIANFIFSQPLALFLLIGALAYGSALPFCFGNNPFDELGTLSILCEDRKLMFWIWVFFVGGGYLVNTNYTYKKYKDNSKFLRIMSAVTFLACCAIALTLKHDVTTFVNNPKRLIHWIATGLYIVCLGASMFIFIMRNRKRYTGFNILAVCILCIVALVPVWLLAFGKSAMMELVPNFLFQVMLMYMNFTNLFKEKQIEK